MNLLACRPGGIQTSIPRVSGDEPLHTDSANFFKKYSPRERG